ncbi:MAG TPA: PTS sugar transporter subunit IIA [Candidatus Brocadiia bacterium]|nr:PTS sugar transporter subunit IIA [Planctomycetota bacterium]MDO8094095.1 PTS sugar transporter subunit IIA [Candidatus Brocadiales bacterium]
MKLTDFVVKEAVLPDIQSTKKEDAIREILCSLINVQKVDHKDVEGIMKSLIKREQLGSTGIGKGVAVPHTKHESITSLVGTVARSKKGIEFDSLDGEPVYIVFLLLSPNDSAGTHLAALERISTVIRNNDFRRFMREAQGKAEMVEIIKDMDELQP